MADEYSYLEELKQLLVTLAQAVVDTPYLGEDEKDAERLEDMCEMLAGDWVGFQKALDEQRQQVSDAAPRES